MTCLYSTASKNSKDRVLRSTKKKKKMMSVLPNDLLIQILLRLPVKSLIRFKCVSKSWLSLISDPHFARSHYELAAARTHRLMYLGVNTLVTRSIYLDGSAHDDSASAAIKLELDLWPPPPKPRALVYILGSCRGFILLGTHCPSRFYLWNPSTSALKQLPASFRIYPSFYGFGYDPSRDDLLVVQGYCRSSAPTHVAEFEFLSLRANSWKEIEGPLMPYYLGGVLAPINVGLLLNGALHWLAVHEYMRVGEKVIVAFDLAKKSFSHVPLPNECQHNTRCHLWGHGGFLNMCVLEVGVAVNIWVMKECMVQSSWSKWAVVPVYDIPTKYFFPICYNYKEGYYYGKSDRGELVKCSSKGELLEHCSCTRGSETARFIHSHAAIVYSESLLPLPGGDNGATQDM